MVCAEAPGAGWRDGHLLIPAVKPSDQCALKAAAEEKAAALKAERRAVTSVKRTFEKSKKEEYIEE